MERCHPEHEEYQYPSSNIRNADVAKHSDQAQKYLIGMIVHNKEKNSMM